MRVSFTLVELLVSLAIVSVILTVVFLTTSSIIDSRERIVKLSKIFSNVLVVMEELKSELESSFSSPGKKSFVLQEAGYFGYTYDSLSFLTFYRGGRKVEYTFVPDEETQTAVLVKRVLDEFSQETDQIYFVKILEGVRSFDVKVFDGDSWQERWDSDRVPLIFDINLEILVNDEVYPFHIVVERRYEDIIFGFVRGRKGRPIPSRPGIIQQPFRQPRMLPPTFR